MKKILNILFLMVLTVSLSAQTTLTFEGKDRTGQDYVQLSRLPRHITPLGAALYFIRNFVESV